MSSNTTLVRRATFVRSRMQCGRAGCAGHAGDGDDAVGVAYRPSIVPSIVPGDSEVGQ